MSLVVARKKRTQLFASVAGLLLIVGLVSLISVEDPNGSTLRIGIVMVTLGAGLWMQRPRELIAVALLAWLAPNLGRSLLDDTYELFQPTMLLEGVGVVAIAAVASVARVALKDLEAESVLIGSHSESLGLNPETGVYEAGQMRPSVEAELARSRRFGRTFALVLVGIDELRQKYDYREAGAREVSVAATARLLRNTRHNVDRVFHYGDHGFAMLLPESSEKDVVGMVRRLRRLARLASPAEGEPGGPLPAHFGATFFPSRATTVDDLFRRAEIALKIAEHNTARYQLDSAEAPEMPPAETLRRAAGDGEAEPLLDMDTVAWDDDEGPKLLETAEDGEPAEAPVALVLVEAQSELVVEDPEPEPAPVSESEYEVADLPQPVFAAAVPQASAVAPVTNTESLEDIEALLKQMDETLSMIRSVRAKAA